MLNCSNVDRYTARVFTGLVLAMTIVVGALTHAACNVQAFV
jgi:hypothetical protein